MHRPVVLLVDDEDDLLSLLTTAFRRALPDIEAVPARTPAEALTVLDRLDSEGRPLCAAVVDQVLEGADGLALVDAVRTRHAGAKILLYTGRADDRTVAQAKARGVRVLWKPTRLSTLVEEVGSCLTLAGEVSR